MLCVAAVLRLAQELWSSSGISFISKVARFLILILDRHAKLGLGVFKRPFGQALLPWARESSYHRSQQEAERVTGGGALRAPPAGDMSFLPSV